MPDCSEYAARCGRAVRLQNLNYIIHSLNVDALYAPGLAWVGRAGSFSDSGIILPIRQYIFWFILISLFCYCVQFQSCRSPSWIQNTPRLIPFLGKRGSAKRRNTLCASADIPRNSIHNSCYILRSLLWSVTPLFRTTAVQKHWWIFFFLGRPVLATLSLFSWRVVQSRKEKWVARCWITSTASSQMEHSRSCWRDESYESQWIVRHSVPYLLLFESILMWRESIVRYSVPHNYFIAYWRHESGEKQ